MRGARQDRARKQADIHAAIRYIWRSDLPPMQKDWATASTQDQLTLRSSLFKCFEAGIRYGRRTAAKAARRRNRK